MNNDFVANIEELCSKVKENPKRHALIFSINSTEIEDCWYPQFLNCVPLPNVEVFGDKRHPKRIEFSNGSVITFATVDTCMIALASEFQYIFVGEPNQIGKDMLNNLKTRIVSYRQLINSNLNSTVE